MLHCHLGCRICYCDCDMNYPISSSCTESCSIVVFSSLGSSIVAWCGLPKTHQSTHQCPSFASKSPFPNPVGPVGRHANGFFSFDPKNHEPISQSFLIWSEKGIQKIMIQRHLDAFCCHVTNFSFTEPPIKAIAKPHMVDAMSKPTHSHRPFGQWIQLYPAC